MRARGVLDVAGGQDRLQAAWEIKVGGAEEDTFLGEEIRGDEGALAGGREEMVPGVRGGANLVDAAGLAVWRVMAWKIWLRPGFVGRSRRSQVWGPRGPRESSAQVETLCNLGGRWKRTWSDMISRASAKPSSCSRCDEGLSAALLAARRLAQENSARMRLLAPTRRVLLRLDSRGTARWES